MTKNSSSDISLSISDKKLVLALLHRAHAEYLDYVAECKADWQMTGYRAHYCRHGVNQWVDYDIPCGMCETYGNYWDYLTELTAARDTVYRAKQLVIKRADALSAVAALGGSISELIPWAGEPLRQLMDLVA